MATEATYLNAKSRSVEFKITKMSYNSSYTGGETFKIFFAYDDNSSYAYPDKPLAVARNRLPPVRQWTEPSLKLEWFPNMNDYIELENGARIVCESLYASGNTGTGVYGINIKSLNLRFVTPNGLNIGGTPDKAGMIFQSDIKENPEAGAAGSNYRLGCWIFMRMTQKWSDFINDLNDSSVSDSTLNQKYRFSNFPVAVLAVAGDYNTYKYQTSASAWSTYSDSMITWNRARWKLFFSGVDPINTTFTGDTSKPGGGPDDPDGKGDNYGDKDKSDDVPTDDPTEEGGPVAASVAGGVKTYLMTKQTLNGFHDFMFSDLFNNSWDSLRKSFYDPQSCVVGLHTIPLQIGTSDLTSENIHLGNLDTNVNAFVIADSYAHIDCGTVHINEVWANFLDYAPYTTASLYLPYCSTVEVPINEIMDADVNIIYNVDLFSGSCVAEVHASKGNFNGVILRVPGNCAVNIPWSAADSSRQWAAVMNIAGAVALSTATAGMSTAAAAATATASRAALAETTAVTAKEIEAMKIKEMGISATESAARQSALNKSIITNATSTVQNAPGIVTQHINRGGSCSSNLGAMQTQYPYFIITRPVQSYPEGYEHYYGFTSNITAQLGTLSGFTKISAVNLANFQKATTDEIQLIKEALESGVYL